MNDLKTYFRNDAPPWLPERTILLTIHGSKAYGLDTPTSDTDYKGVAIPPREYFTGFLDRFEQHESHQPLDLVIFDIRKFFAMACDCNPNIIEVLWTDEADLLVLTKEGRAIRDLRQDFLSQKAKHTFSGYAVAQLKRIRTHRHWLMNPPKAKPERTEYNLPETALVSKDQMGVIKKYEAGGQCDLEQTFGENVMEYYRRERSYWNALNEWKQYEHWKATRNPARAAIEAKHGYDCKHAMHLVRLLRMCREILTTGEVLVKRPDRDELLAIREGAWEYDQLVEWAERQDSEMDLLVRDSVILPHSPNRKYLDEKCREIIEAYNWPS